MRDLIRGLLQWRAKLIFPARAIVSGGLLCFFCWLMVFFHELLEKIPGHSNLAQTLMLLMGPACLLAMPVGLGGWLFIWGDNGPLNHPLFESLTFHIVCSLVACTLFYLVVRLPIKRLIAYLRKEKTY